MDVYKYTEDPDKLVQSYVYKCKQSAQRDAVKSSNIRQQVFGEFVIPFPSATMAGYHDLSGF